MKTCADCGADSLHDLCYNCESLLLLPKHSQNYYDGLDDGRDGLPAMEYPDTQAGNDYRDGYADGQGERNRGLDMAEQHPIGYDWQR